jgi:hypothetical protein
MTGAISDWKSEEGAPAPFPATTSEGELEILWGKIDGEALNPFLLIQEVIEEFSAVQLIIPMGKRVAALRSRAKK